MKERSIPGMLSSEQPATTGFQTMRSIARLIIRIFAGLFLFASLPCFASNEIDLVRILKAERKIMLLSEGKIRREFRIALGSNPFGPKQHEDDGRTPEGRYVLDYRVKNSGFHKALHISYPNAAATEAAVLAEEAPGEQVMIHGQRNGFGWLAFLSQRFDWTNGSIALSNRDMDIVWRLVKPGTPIDLLP